MIANATGAFFDLRQGRALKLDPSQFGVAYDEAEPMECLPRKIPIPAQGGTHGEPFSVPCWALDPNGHLTSAMYFAVAENALPPGFTFDRVRMEFKRQIKPGETVSPVLYALPENKAVVDLRNGAGDSCAAAEFSTRKAAQG